MISSINFRRRSSQLLFLIFLSILVLSCKNGEKEEDDVMLTDENSLEQKTDMNESDNVVNIRTENMDIIMPDTLQPGWTTFRYENDSDMVHLILLDKLPVVNGRQIRMENLLDSVGPVFQDAMNLINQGKAEEGYAQFANFPSWVSDVVYTGGVGLVSAGGTAETTFKLEPGIYVFECYVKTGGQFHNIMGMSTEVVVTGEPLDATEPDAETKITLSGARGIEVDGEMTAGTQLVEVYFEDQKAHENTLGHDLHLARISDTTNLKDLEVWMDPMQPGGMETSNVPVEFLGGIQDMPGGNTAYVKVDLRPGKYAWISEVPNAGKKNMLKVFEVK